MGIIKALTGSVGLVIVTLGQIFFLVNSPPNFVALIVLTVIQLAVGYGMVRGYLAYEETQRGQLLQEINRNNEIQRDTIAKTVNELLDSEERTREGLELIRAAVAEGNIKNAALQENTIRCINETGSNTINSLIQSQNMHRQELERGINKAAELIGGTHDNAKRDIIAELSQLIKTVSTEAIAANALENAALGKALQEVAPKIANEINASTSAIGDQVAAYNNGVKLIGEDIDKVTANIRADIKKLITADQTNKLISIRLQAFQDVILNALSENTEDLAAIQQNIVILEGKTGYNRFIGQTLLTLKTMLEDIKLTGALQGGERTEKIGAVTIKYLGNRIIEEIDEEAGTKTIFNYANGVLAGSEVIKDDDVIYGFEYHPNQAIAKSSEFKNGKLFMEYLYYENGELKEVITHDKGKTATLRFNENGEKIN